MNSHGSSRRRVGIMLRTALLSWMVAIVTVLIFAAVILPEQKRALVENLQSKAHGAAIALADIAAGATVTSDFSPVVLHCLEILKSDTSVDHIVLTRNDGYSLIHDQHGWSAETNLLPSLRPTLRVASSRFEVCPVFNRRVFHYSMPFDYQGIQWGWIHLGLSSEAYERNVATVTRRTLVLAGICIAISFLASMAYARRLVGPILRLRAVVQNVAAGDLVARAAIESSDEVGELAVAINQMTQAVQERDARLRDQNISLARMATEKTLLSGDLRAASQVITELSLPTTGATRCTIWLASPNDSQLECLDAFDRRSGRHESVDALDLRLFPAYRAALDRDRCVAAADAAHAPATRELSAPYLLPLSITSILHAPVRRGASLIGVVAHDHAGRPRSWSLEEQNYLASVADLVALVLEARDRQLAREALVAAKEAAEAASRTKSQFLANMSHEIRTPLTGVMGMLQLLGRTGLDPRQTRCVTQALTAAETLLTVLGDVLDFSKIEAGKLTLSESTFNLADTMDAALRLLAERAETKGVELACRIADNIPGTLIGDPNRLRQVLLNLLNNAIKFTEQGEIVVSCSCPERSLTHATLSFDIRDTGCGIPEEHQSRLFESFSQADSSMARTHGGAGLGLAISRQLCELMGGSIGLESCPGRGSLFWFQVRLRLPETQPPTHPPIHPIDLRNLRVLVVDDCATTRDILAESLVSWQCRPDHSSSASEAWDKLNRAADVGDPFRVAVIDWRMSDDDGFSLARRIRSHPRLAVTGLVLLSNSSFHADPLELGAAGFAASLPKPARRSDLYNAVLTAANGRPFHVSPPTGSPEPVPPPPPQPFDDDDADRPLPTVLLAEDNDINREVARELLASLGYRCRCVASGADAVNAVRSGGIDLVLMDCQMPGMDGYAATSIIRRWEDSLPASARPHPVPIVALTAHAMKGDRDRCLAAGMNDYLTKPLDPDAIEATLRRWLVVPSASPSGSATWTVSPSPGPARTAGPDTLAPVHPTPSASDEPIAIDFASLLKRCMGKQDLAERLVAKFRQQAQVDADNLKDAIDRRDRSRIEAIAHRLRGSAANVAARAVIGVASQLEVIARQEALPGAHDAWNLLQQEINRLPKAVVAPVRPTDA